MTPPVPHFDVVILGGGPAGTAAGLTLLQCPDLSVAVLEASTYATPRIGESLTPGVRPLLEYLGVWETFRRTQPLDAFGSQAAWGAPTPHTLDYLFTLHGTGWHLDRVRFDKMLAAAFAERGGTLCDQTRFLAAERDTAAGWQIVVANATQARTRIRCRFLIDATGRAGLLARHLGQPRLLHDRLVGVGCLGTVATGASLEAHLLVEACSYGWWYSAPIPGNRLSVVLMSDADLISQMRGTQPARWHALLRETALTRQRAEQAHFSAKPRTFLSQATRLRQPGGADWVAVGDAAAAYDPLSSMGIPHALATGIHGARVAANTLLAEGGLLPPYQQALETDFRQYLRTAWQHYRRETRWPEAPFWQRRTTPVAIDAQARVATTQPLTDTADPVHLPRSVAPSLLAHAARTRRAHTCVRSFAQAHPQFPDQRIILALQTLADQGYLTWEKHPPPTPAVS